MNKNTALKSLLVGVMSLTLTGCSGESLADRPDLLSSSAHCITAPDFGGCLLSSFVTHSASLSYPEELKFSPYYAQILATGYDRELRRKEVNKFVEGSHKDRSDKAFLYSDMYLNARSKTPEGTRKAISILNNGPRTIMRDIDPLLEQWLKNSDIFDEAFTQALLMKFSEKWMLDSSVWDERPGMKLGQSSFEVLSRAFEKIGDQASANKIIADMKKQKFYPLREMLKPVYTGRKSLTDMNGEALKDAGFFVEAIKPLIEQQIAENARPKTIFSNLVYATRYGQGDNKGDRLVEMALDYAYKKNDKRSIIQFADQIIDVPIDFSNGLITTLTRANRLGQDLVLIQYLDAMGDQARIERIAKMWDPMSQRLPSGKYPTWAGGSIGDYVNILHHARRTANIVPYLQTFGDEMPAKEIARLKKSPASLAVTLEKLKKIESKTTEQATGRRQNFYPDCAKNGGVSSHKLDVQIYCANKIKSHHRRVLVKLIMAETLYEQGNYKTARELTKEALSDAAACACIKQIPFSSHDYRLSNIIVAELRK